MFGHGSFNCNIAPKCVRCAGDHLTANCALAKNNPKNLNCVNCGGKHTASNKNCPTYKQHIENKSTVTTSNTVGNRNRLNHNIPNVISNGMNSQTSYASVTKRNTPNNDSNYNHFLTLSNELKELNSICNLKQMIKVVRDLKV